MKRLYTYSVLATFLCLASFSSISFAQTGIFQSYVTLDYNGSLKYLDDDNAFNPKGVNDLDGHFLGTFKSNDVFELAGADIHTFKNVGAGNDVTGTELNYSVYKTGGSPSFTSTSLGFCCNSGNALCIDGVTICDTGGGAGDQKWFLESLGVDLLSGLDPGDYTLEVFYKAYTNLGDRFNSNGGSNFKATFTVGTEGFSDGDLTSGTVWSGETSSFAILDPTSLSGNGSNSNINGATEINDEVLVSNASTADAVITTPYTMAYGSWQFSIATGSAWNTSNINGLKVYLISDTDNVTDLKDGTTDFNGYVVEFGISGTTDTFTLVKVSGSTKTDIVTTAYPGTLGLFDGYRLRVTRDYSGNWELFADQGFDGPAASTSRGTATDNDIKTSSFFALGTEITDVDNSRRGYFDNISLNSNTEISFDSSSSDNDETDGSVVVNLDIANPSLVDACTADVVLIKGDPSRIDSYSTQSFTFPAGSSASLPLTINITDNDDCDYNTSIVLEIQSVSGGINASVHPQSTFTLNLTDDNTTLENDVNDDFEDGDLIGWTGETSLFTNVASSELSGSQALYVNNTLGDNISYLVKPNTIRDLKGGVTTWRVSVSTPGLRDPNDLNRFTVFLSSNGNDPADTGIQGYAIAVNEGGNTDDRLRLYRIDSNTSATELIKYEVPSGWSNFDNFAIEVTRDEAGNWEMYVNDQVDFTALIPADAINMPVLDNTYDFMGSSILVSHQDQTDWEVYFDDLSVTQEFCSGAYETTGTGNSSGSIWQLVGTATPATPPFNKYTDIIVKDGDVLTLDSDVRTGEVTVETLGELNLGIGDHEVEIFDDLTINGLLSSNKGTVSMIGNQAAQIVSGTATPVFYQFDVSNSLGVSFNTDADFYGPIHPESGTISFGSQNITLASGDIGGEILTGSIGTIETGADVTGQITMERYVENTEEGYRLIGVPVTGQTVASAHDGDFLLTGFPGSDFPGQDFTNLKYYDETDPSCNLNDGFTDVTSMTETIDAEQGYWAFMPLQAMNYTLNSTGAFNKGDVTVNLDYTTGCDAQTIGWNCIANPFPSAIDIASSEIVFVNCQPDVYILDHTLGSTWKGEYVSYVNGVSINGGSNILSSYQGFFVRATGPGASITFKEGCKVDDQAGFLRFDDVSRVLLRFSVNSENHKYETVVSFHDQASNEFDDEFDGYFLESNSIEDGGLTLSTLVGENTLSVNTLNSLSEPVVIPFRAIVPFQGDYTFRLDALQNISESVCLIIEDQETNEFFPILEGTEIFFNAPSDNYETERFVLHAYPGADYTSYMASCSGDSDGVIELNAPSYSDWSVQWFDQENTLLNAETVGLTSVLSGVTAGSYHAVLSSENENCSTIEQNITVFEPAAELLQVNEVPSVCSEDVGQVITNLENANQWYIGAFEESLLIAESYGEGTVSLGDLPGAVYTLVIESECISEEIIVDLRDENAVVTSFESPVEVMLNEISAEFVAVNTSENAQYSEWFINGLLVSEEDDLLLEFLSPGDYEVRLVTSNEFCSDESVQVVTVSAADNVNENTLVFEVLNLKEGLQINANQDFIGVSIALYDASAKVVFSENLNSQSKTFLMNKLSVGIYTLVILENEDPILIQKIFR